MKIGIVSAQKHCKTHLRQLTKDGHEVYCLGAKPTRIPSSYDALIVRIASMRHCDSYKEWHKITGRPVIYEDGLSGIRRELAKISTSQPKLATASISVQEVRDRMVEWGVALIEARPQDSRSAVSRHLSTTLKDQFPSMASDSKALVASVVGQLFATVPITPQEPLAEPMKDTADAGPVPLEQPVTLDYPTQLRPLPSEEAWTTTYTEAKLKLAYEQAIECLGVMGTARSGLTKKDLCREFKKAERGRKMTRAFAKTLAPHIRRNPLKYVMLVFLAMPEDHPFVDKAFTSSYKEITGFGGDTRLRHAIRWYLGREQPVHEPTVITPPAQKKEPQVKPGEALPALPAHFRSSSKRPEAFANQYAEAVQSATVEPEPTEPAASAASAAFDNTPTIVGLLDAVERMESQIKTLQDRMDGQGRRGKTVVDALKEELRSDISDAFDALAAEQQASTDLSSNPFAALEQVKAMLKAAGFKGTLTLTIE
jgi:hypothetical protein